MITFGKLQQRNKTVFMVSQNPELLGQCTIIPDPGLQKILAGYTAFADGVAGLRGDPTFLPAMLSYICKAIVAQATRVEASVGDVEIVLDPDLFDRHKGSTEYLAECVEYTVNPNIDNAVKMLCFDNDIFGLGSAKKGFFISAAKFARKPLVATR